MGNNGYGLGATFKRVLKVHLLLLPSCHLLKTAFVRSSHMTRILELHKAIPRCCSTVEAARAVNSKQGWTQALARTVNMCAIGQVTLIITWSCYQFEIMQAFMARRGAERSREWTCFATSRLRLELGSGDGKFDRLIGLMI